MGQTASTEDSWSIADEAGTDAPHDAEGPCVRGAYAEWRRKGKQPVRPEVGPDAALTYDAATESDPAPRWEDHGDAAPSRFEEPSESSNTVRDRPGPAEAPNERPPRARSPERRRGSKRPRRCEGDATKHDPQPANAASPPHDGSE